MPVEEAPVASPTKREGAISSRMTHGKAEPVGALSGSANATTATNPCMRIEIGGYGIVPYKSGECWQIERYDEGGAVIRSGRHKGKTVQPGWKKIDFYPGSLERSVEYIAEHVLRRTPALACDLGELRDEITEMKASLLCAIVPACCESCTKGTSALLARHVSAVAAGKDQEHRN